MKKVSLFYIIILYSISTLCFSDTIHVPGDQPTIQAGIDTAVNGDTVLVERGTYMENINFKGKAITVKSDEGMNYSVINGKDPVNPDYGSAVLFENGEGADSVLQGFTLKRGSGTQFMVHSEIAAVGGGICCHNSSPTIIECLIMYNSADHGAGIGCIDNSSPNVVDSRIYGNTSYIYDGFGGGVFCDSASTPFFTNVKITENTADYGGGFACTGSSTPIISDSKIAVNSTWQGGTGGGLYCGGASSPTITNTTIFNNKSSYGYGGGVFCRHSSPVITNCTIDKNSGHYSGGIGCDYFAYPEISNTVISRNTALYGGGISCTDRSSPIISKCVVVDNTAEKGGGVFCWDESSPELTSIEIIGNEADDGGGFYCIDTCNPKILNCTIDGNTATSNGGSGGGIYCMDYCKPTFANTTITGNSAHDYGGGIYCIDSVYPIITNSTIIGNTAVVAGGGISVTEESSPTLTNSIYWDNSAPIGPEIWIGTTYHTSASLTISWSDVKGGQSSVFVDPGGTLNWGSGNIDADPLFVDPANNDYHLMYFSPCKDAGDNSAATALCDFEEDPRIADGTVDMGADEFYRHLYYTGHATPNSCIDTKLIGVPMQTADLYIGTDILASPRLTKFGLWYLNTPITSLNLGVVPWTGVYTVRSRVPPNCPTPLSIPLQGLSRGKLTNLCTIEITSP